MSEETKKIEEKKHSLSLQQQIYQGPLPPPKILEEYEKIKKGAAKEIFEMARKAQEHNIFQEEKRINLVEKKMKYNFIFGLIGQIGTIVITLVGYFSAFIYIKEGEPKLGYLCAGISTVISSYLIWWKVRSENKEQDNNKNS